MQGKNTPLHIAAREGHKEVMKVLLDHGANLNALSEVSLYSLHTHTNPDTVETVD